MTPADSPFAELFSLSELDRIFHDDQLDLAGCRAFLTDTREQLYEAFRTGHDIEELVRARSWLVDQVLIRFWKAILPDIEAALVAVGGYGRNELLPGSDIDLMLLLQEQEDEETGEHLHAFLMALWDIGLEVGHSVRTLDDCSEQAAADITVATNLMEARLLTGSEPLFQAMRERTGPDRIWPSREFFGAKLLEQEKRYKRLGDAVHNLEPNVKEGPGGLRDAQMIGWVAKRHFGLDNLQELVTEDFLTSSEYQSLMQGQHFLWKTRFGLHMLTGRREDRLLFDLQRNLAEQFGYQRNDGGLAVEWFMMDYYRTIQELSRLNEMLLQLFQEVILYADDPGDPVEINRRFQTRKGFLEVTDERIFRRYPFALLELFLIMQQHPEIKGVRASTIRLIRDHRYLIDDSFRSDIRSRSLFMEIFRQPRGLTHELRRMNRYGILAAYYPTFEKIVGQMQHDLFHAYTVDEHTLFVVRNLRRFAVPEFKHEFPLCSRISSRLPKPELLYLAGFFHDIAKGRGGNHSELGAADAMEFLRLHDLSDYDLKLVAWLVENHLLMSQIAQRRDISDPDVINEFARQIGDRTRLDYLYLLTVADIRGTNPTLWNSWKDALFRDLYMSTRGASRRGLENPLHRDELIRDLKISALKALKHKHINEQLLQTLWEDFPNDYFLRHYVDEVVWHAEIILEPGNIDGIRVDLCPCSERGGSALFMYTPVIDHLFSRSTALLNQLGLSITDARIITSKRNYAVNTFILLDSSGEPILDHYQGEELVTLLEQELANPSAEPRPASQTAPRRIRHFKVSTRINFQQDDSGRRTILELIATDSPGLLSRIGQVFHSLGIQIQNAKIATFGAQVEDVFYITGADNEPLSESLQQDLGDQLTAVLDEA